MLLPVYQRLRTAVDHANHAYMHFSRQALVRIPCDLHLLKSTRSESRPRAFQADTRRLFAAIEAVIFQFLLMRAGRSERK